MKNAALLALGLLACASALAGGPPPMAPEPHEVPLATDIGLVGISLVLAGLAARSIARRFR